MSAARRCHWLLAGILSAAIPSCSLAETAPPSEKGKAAGGYALERLDEIPEEKRRAIEELLRRRRGEGQAPVASWEDIVPLELGNLPAWTFTAQEASGRPGAWLELDGHSRGALHLPGVPGISSPMAIALDVWGLLPDGGFVIETQVGPGVILPSGKPGEWSLRVARDPARDGTHPANHPEPLLPSGEENPFYVESYWHMRQMGLSPEMSLSFTLVRRPDGDKGPYYE